MSYLQTPKSRYNPSLTQAQLEEVTSPDRSAGKREQSAFVACGLEQKTLEQQEMDDLSESWDWFTDVLDQAKDQDYRPAAPLKPTVNPSAPTASPVRTGSGQSARRWTNWTVVSAALALICVLGIQFWTLSGSTPTLVQQNGTLNGAKNGAKSGTESVTKNKTKNETTVEAIAAANKAQATAVKAETVTDLPESLFAWEDEETFDDDLSRLSESFANYTPGDNWSTTVACSYQSLDESFDSWQEDNSGF